MIAFLVIPGVCALFAYEDLILKRRPLVRDILFYSVALTLLCHFFADGVIQAYEGIVMVATYVFYLCVVVGFWRANCGDRDDAERVEG